MTGGAIVDTAEERAEKRANLELQIKADTLALEKEKFLWTRARGFPNRLGAVLMRAATALLFAHGSTGLVCLNSYKALSDILTLPVLQKAIYFLIMGFTTAIGAYMCAAFFVAAAMDDLNIKLNSGARFAILSHRIFTVISLSALGAALFSTVTALTGH